MVPAPQALMGLLNGRNPDDGDGLISERQLYAELRLQDRSQAGHASASAFAGRGGPGAALGSAPMRGAAGGGYGSSISGGVGAVAASSAHAAYGAAASAPSGSRRGARGGAGGRGGAGAAAGRGGGAVSAADALEAARSAGGAGMFPSLHPAARNTWIWPSSEKYADRAYQLQIAAGALFQNTLVRQQRQQAAQHRRCSRRLQRGSPPRAAELVIVRTGATNLVALASSHPLWTAASLLVA